MHLFATAQATGPGGTTNYTVPIDGSTYTYTLPAPSTLGSYQVVSSFAPAPGNSLSPASSAPQPLAVTASTATVAEELTPNPAQPNGAVLVNGTVTSAGSPQTGTVQLYVSPSAKDVPRVMVCQRRTLVLFSGLSAGTVRPAMSCARYACGLL